MTNTPRGLRLSNPGHIERRPGTDWAGMSPDQPDPRFVSFVSPMWGIRAIAKIMLTYRNKHGLKTVRQIITRWAPPEDDNPTTTYAMFVANAIGVDLDEEINVLDYDTMLLLVTAIIRFETGQQPYAPVQIEDGVRLAGVFPRTESV